MENPNIITDAVSALIGLAAATASSNTDAFQGYAGRAEELGISKEEMIQAVNIALRVKMSVHQEIMEMAQACLVGGGCQCGEGGCSDDGCGCGEGCGCGD